MEGGDGEGSKDSAGDDNDDFFRFNLHIELQSIAVEGADHTNPRPSTKQQHKWKNPLVKRKDYRKHTSGNILKQFSLSTKGGNIDFLFIPFLRGRLSLFNPPFLYSRWICGISCQPASPMLQRRMHHCQNESDQKKGGEASGGSLVWESGLIGAMQNSSPIGRAACQCVCLSNPSTPAADQ